MTLTSSTVTYSNGSFSGTGDLIYLDLNTSSATGLVAGTYNFSSNRDVLTFVDGNVARNFDLATQTGENISITGGTVKVDVDGTVYTFTLNLTTSSGKTVTGYYKGALTTI